MYVIDNFSMFNIYKLLQVDGKNVRDGTKLGEKFRTAQEIERMFS